MGLIKSNPLEAPLREGFRRSRSVLGSGPDPLAREERTDDSLGEASGNSRFQEETLFPYVTKEKKEVDVNEQLSLEAKTEIEDAIKELKIWGRPYIWIGEPHYDEKNNLVGPHIDFCGW